MLKDTKGEIRVFSDHIEFNTPNNKQHLNWKYDMVQQIEILSPTKLRIWSYEDQVWLLGRDKRFTFQVFDGKLDEKLISFLRSRVERPFVIAFATNEQTETPLAELAVKHFHRLGGCQGTLKIYQNKLVFSTADGQDSREWLWQDIQTISHSDKWELELTSYEKATGVPNRSYRFALKAPIPEKLYEQIWQKVYPSAIFPAKL
jgi:hypothetical protein